MVTSLLFVVMYTPDGKVLPYRKVFIVDVYVLQVVSGQEARVVNLIDRYAGDVVDDCFVPRYELLKRRDGQWVRRRERLFPGYVFVKTDRPDDMENVLRTLPVFTRLLGASGTSFVPLTREDVAWLDAHIDGETHTMGFSEGVIVGDEVIVTSGPLKGREAQIAKIDRHKRMAWLVAELFGRRKTIRVGLEIVSKR